MWCALDLCALMASSLHKKTTILQPAKGGILAAIARQRPLPVYFIGVGEQVEDLQPFSAREFADALLG